MSRPRVDELVPLAQAILASRGGAVHCCLHIVLDDENLSRDSVRFCAMTALERDHPDCLRLALALLRMKRRRRRAVGLRSWGFK